eukprot:9061087-Pyramimonas_sp.AAC.1
MIHPCAFNTWSARGACTNHCPVGAAQVSAVAPCARRGEAQKSLAGQEHVVGEAKVCERGGGGEPQLNAPAILLPFGDQQVENAL